jgi:hypothetical protein
MKQAVWHDRQQETMEAKTLWFRSLSIAERMEVFCSFTDLILSVKPNMKDRRYSQPIVGHIQVLSAPRINNNEDAD